MNESEIADIKADLKRIEQRRDRAEEIISYFFYHRDQFYVKRIIEMETDEETGWMIITHEHQFIGWWHDSPGMFIGYKEQEFEK